MQFHNSNYVGSLDNTKQCGRPKKAFSDLSDRGKRKLTELLRLTSSSEELAFATSMNLRSSGNEPAAKLIKEITETTPTRASRIQQKWRADLKTPTEIPVEEALELFISADFTKSQYQKVNIRYEHRKLRF